MTNPTPAEPARRHTVDTITSDALDQLHAERNEARQSYLGACETIAAMHAAAVGAVRGPDQGLVKDVEAVRLRAERAERAEAAIARVRDYASRLDRLADITVSAPDRSLYRCIAIDLRAALDEPKEQ